MSLLESLTTISRLKTSILTVNNHQQTQTPKLIIPSDLNSWNPNARKTH